MKKITQNEMLADPMITEIYDDGASLGHITAFANNVLAKYAQPSEREIIKRERAAFIAGSCWRYNKDGGGRATGVTDSERRAAMLHYPFPPIEPPPDVLTDEEVHELWGWNDDGADRALTRKIERAVLTKLAEQKP